MIFSYEATDKDGVLTKGDFEAANEKAVIEHLERKGLIAISVYGFGRTENTSGLNRGVFETVTALDRILMVRNLAASLRAGLGLVEALDILIADANKGVVKEILLQAKTNLQNGQPLSATFAGLKDHFPPVFVGMLKAGESSGKLDSALEQLSQHLTREYNLTKKIKSAMAYPILLLGASLVVSLLLILFVVPRLVKAFKQGSVQMPLITQVLVGVSNALRYSVTLDIVGLGLFIALIVYVAKTTKGRQAALAVLSRLPVAHELVNKISLVRLTRTLGSLIGSGTSIIEALRLTGDSVGNDAYKKALAISMNQVENGVPFSRTLEAFPDLYPRFLTGLIVVGERTGTMEHIFKTFADFYDDDIDNTLKDLTNLVEPILLLFMGLLIGTIALSILMPIYQLTTKIT